MACFGQAWRRSRRALRDRPNTWNSKPGGIPGGPQWGRYCAQRAAHTAAEPQAAANDVTEWIVRMTIDLPATSEANIGLAPINRSTVGEAVRDALRQLIIDGGVTFGEPLRQDELAARLNVSRTPLREALHALAAEGLVSIDARRGAMVTKPTVQQLLDLYEIREPLEVLAGRRAVEASDTMHIAELTRINDRMAATSDPGQWAQLNQEFHALLYRPCPNKDLLALIATLATRAKFYVRILASAQSPARIAVRDHEHMLEAARLGDADALEEAIRHHLRSTVASVAPTLQKDPSDG